MSRTATLFTAVTLVVTPACGQEPAAPGAAVPLDGVRVTTVVDGLEHPWGMAFLPDGSILVTERPGRLRVVRDGTLEPSAVSGVPEVWAQGQGGLLDVALHPDFERNRLVYLSYAKPGPGGRATTAVARGRFDGGTLVGTEDIFVADAWGRGGVHFGSRLLFDADGHLFVTVGERGQQDEAQNRANHQGTVLRLHDDGSVPADNPFVGEAGIRPEIWAFGIRSPQGLALHPGTGDLLETEHGPRGGDELNRILPGRNYGWPIVTYGINYNGTPVGDGIQEAPGMEPPLTWWVPSIATSGLMIYDGDAFPEWRGSAFVGGLAGTHLARVPMEGLRVTGEPEVLLGELGLRIRDVRQGPEGAIWVLVDDGDAPLLRLEPAGQ